MDVVARPVQAVRARGVPPLWAGAAVVGGLIGSYLGARRFSSVMIRRLLAVVLVIAGAKLVFDGASGLGKSEPSRQSPTSGAPAAQSPGT